MQLASLWANHAARFSLCAFHPEPRNPYLIILMHGSDIQILFLNTICIKNYSPSRSFSLFPNPNQRQKEAMDSRPSSKPSVSCLEPGVLQDASPVPPDYGLWETQKWAAARRYNEAGKSPIIARIGSPRGQKHSLSVHAPAGPSTRCHWPGLPPVKTVAGLLSSPVSGEPAQGCFFSPKDSDLLLCGGNLKFIIYLHWTVCLSSLLCVTAWSLRTLWYFHIPFLLHNVQTDP